MGPADDADKRRGEEILNKEQGRKNDEGRRNWELGIWNWGRQKEEGFHAKAQRLKDAKSDQL
ncbi:hypothetical protein SY85_14285 [Flavisolibacter tropicus]|uniref:Uncharacterized protein n=1 Tax=Flavisolibacter tropicus TaxID=1492898 RepID=A0A172TWN5_9BACT|nr:hypothetical protein SY85_14285 [Flavisolibacter tropicus]